MEDDYSGGGGIHQYSGNPRFEIYNFAGDTGTYYLNVGADAGWALGTYEIFANEITEDIPIDDYSNDINTTGRLEINSSVTGTIETQGDRDWFQVTLQENQNYDISASFEYIQFNVGGENYDSQPNPNLGSNLIIYDFQGNLIETSHWGGNASIELGFEQFEATYSGNYFISVDIPDFSLANYTLSLSGPSDDYAGDVSTTGSFEVNEYVSGELETEGDYDWFAISLEA